MEVILPYEECICPVVQGKLSFRRRSASSSVPEKEDGWKERELSEIQRVSRGKGNLKGLVPKQGGNPLRRSGSIGGL